jgi:hypothetical protein
VARVVNAGASLQPSLDGVVLVKMYSYGPTVTDMSLQGLYQFITIDMGLFLASVAFIYILNWKLGTFTRFMVLWEHVWGRAGQPIRLVTILLWVVWNELNRNYFGRGSSIPLAYLGKLEVWAMCL